MLFATAAGLITALTKAAAEGRLDERLKVYTVPRLLAVDEIGYLPIDRAEANLFFRGTARVEWMFVFGLAAYNLVRMRNLAAQSVWETRQSVLGRLRRQRAKR